MLHRSNQFYPNIATSKQGIYGQIVNRDQVSLKDALLLAELIKKKFLSLYHYILKLDLKITNACVLLLTPLHLVIVFLKFNSC